MAAMPLTLNTAHYAGTLGNRKAHKLEGDLLRLIKLEEAAI